MISNSKVVFGCINMLPQNKLLKSTVPVIIQTALAHRKPRWLPVAKSKIYRIPRRPEIPEEERVELLRINANYKTQMRAIRRFYYEDMMKEKSTLQSETSEMSQKLEAEDWEQCTALNEKWNKQVAAEREERRKLQIAAMEERALKYMAEKDEEIKATMDKVTEKIRKEKELSKTFITPETLDEAIDRAIENPIDYNYALDLKGTKYEGRDKQISTFKTEKQEQLAA